MAKPRLSQKLFSLFFTLTLSTSALATYHTPCHPCNPELCWKNTFGLYGWIMGQSGDMRVDGNTIDLDISVGDVLSNLNLIDFIMQFHAETSNGCWSYFTDATLLKVTVGATQQRPGPLPDINIRSSTRLSLVDFAAVYNIFERCFDNHCSWFKLELYGGGRDLYYATDLRLNEFTRSDNAANWLSLLVGLRGTWQATPSITVVGRLDGAIGNINHSYNASLLAGYSFNDCITLFAGARVLDFCGKQGAGSDRFVMDLTYFGPVVGAALNW